MPSSPFPENTPPRPDQGPAKAQAALPVSSDKSGPEAPLSPAAQRQRERKRRRRELLLAAFGFVLVLILTSIQLNQFRAVDALFVVMFNVNFVLLIGILFVVLRNGFKLLLERRRRVLGSRLRTRLVLAFVGLAILPCLLMFFVTAKYVQLSMDFWFKEQIETSMETALDLTSYVYEKIGLTLVGHARNIAAEARERALPWGGREMDLLLERKRQEYGGALSGLYGADGVRHNWHGVRGSTEAWNQAWEQINRDQLANQGYAYALVSTPKQDFIIALLAVDQGKSGYLVQGFAMGEGFNAGIERIVRGSREYKTLRSMKRPLKLMLYSSLGVLTAIIILGAVWFGFRLARELSAPIFALAAGTDRIAKGDLSVRLSDSSQDEFGMLIRSFNRMAQDLETARHETTSAYTLLEERNQQTAQHSKYIETVLNNIGSGVVSLDDRGYINTINKAACEILALTPDQLMGQQIKDLLPEPFGLLAEEAAERFNRRQESRIQQNINLSVGGEERRLLVNVVGFSTEGVYRGAVAVFEDISELERMQRMAAWREVARRIAHEIKNPLTPIKLSAQRLARKFGPEVHNPAFIQSTELIVRQVEHLQAMVQEFSAFAKLPEVRPVPGRLEPLLRASIDLFRNSHSSISWHLDIPHELPELPMDKEALNRAFINIFVNAVEALQLAGTPDPTVRVSATYRPDLNLVRVDITDNGPGLNEEERSRLFEPYFSRKKGGTGLGLTIVRSIVTDHHGYVRALPQDDGGTAISMELPLA